ncbi:hypothetical protein NE237_033128 [Protea cynaroides]|uniref:Uncharacterized protein n=1 Tax=Protea cynaroides TaxID=273540 RepID=A0A9Q0L5G2_9MAGN|nr:hypothetical protein NE237_033128 [Protea cynaroides]
MKSERAPPTLVSSDLLSLALEKLLHPSGLGPIPEPHAVQPGPATYSPKIYPRPLLWFLSENQQTIINAYLLQDSSLAATILHLAPKFSALTLSSPTAASFSTTYSFGLETSSSHSSLQSLCLVHDSSNSSSSGTQSLSTMKHFSNSGELLQHRSTTVGPSAKRLRTTYTATENLVDESGNLLTYEPLVAGEKPSHGES